MAWNFHLFLNPVSICCETFRNGSNFGLKSFLALFQFVSADLLYNLYVSMFRNKKYMAWNFHLFSNLVSVCCETFRNVANFGLSHFWVCFNLFQSIYYIIYMFQCFATRNIWPGFSFSLFLVDLVSICCKTFRNKKNGKRLDLQISFLGLFQFVSVDLLYNLYVSMFRNKKYLVIFGLEFSPFL